MILRHDSGQVAEIIPVIIAKDFKELKEKIRVVEPHSKWVQLDIMDGKLVPNKTWNNPAELKKIKTPLKIEAHLMIENPQKVVEKWLEVVQRVIVHWESRGVEKLKFNKKIGIALNPETPWQEIEKIIPDIDLVLLMTVNPGFGGQKFQPEVLAKIKSLRQAYPNIKIEVDGGINPETGKKCVEAGANILVSGSYIFTSKNPAQTIKKLKNI